MDRSSNNTSNGTSQDSLYSGVDFGSHGDNEIVDLTTRHSSPGIPTPAPSRHHSPNSLDTLVEDILSEETLLALGIAIGEIRAQREIERRLEEEARQLEYAQQLQRQFRLELLDVTAGTPTASTTHTINLPSPPHVTIPPSPPQLQRTLAQMNSSANNDHGAIGAPNANSFGKRRSLSSNNESQNKRQRFYGPAAAPTVGQHMIPSSSSSSAESSSILSPGETVILENSNVAILAITGDNSQPHPIEPLPTPPLPAATLPTEPISAEPLLVQHLPKSRKEEGGNMGKQAVEDLLSSRDDSTGNHHIDATQAPVSSSLKVNLMEHQKAGYNWMCQKEDSDLKGGLLADDMGLGKTIQSLALITGRPCTDAPPPITQPYPYSEPPQIKSKATLIICPINLVSQWAHEIETKTENLAVYKHQGYRRLTNPYEIATYDVIVMPYSIVSNDLDPYTIVRSAGKTGCLTSITFHRVILDEAHAIKNWSTITARNCIRIKATYRWCLTASPVQARIDDLYGLFAFLKIQPYCDHNVFRQQLLLPMSQGVSVADKIQSVMKIICLRRLKNAQVDGLPIVALPQMHENILHVDFDESERQYYSSVNAEVQGQFQALTRNGMDKANYFSLLALLTKLQRACLHPSLDDNTLAAGIQVINHAVHIRNAKALDPTVVNRLKISLQDESAIVCPICMDAPDEAMVIPECGHILCKRCLGLYLTSDSSHLPNKLCPECRGPLAQKKVVPAAVFTEVFLSPQRTNKKQLSPSTKPSKKVELLLDILKAAREQSGGHDKTIVFTQFVPFVAILAEHLHRNGYKFMRYDTSVSTENRMKIIDGFRADPTVEVLLMLTKQGNVGLNLTMANRMVIMDSGWNPSMEDQAIGRVLRIGQTKEVHVHRLIIKNTVEDRIHECCHQTKEAVSSAYSGEVNTIGTKQLAYLICGTVSPLTSSSISGPST